MLEYFFEQATIIYYKYFTKPYIEGEYYRIQEIQQRIHYDKNGLSY